MNPMHRANGYYEHNYGIDYERVTRKFANVPRAGTATAQQKQASITVRQQSIGIGVLLDHLVKYGPVIVLTNALLLKCKICNANDVNDDDDDGGGHHADNDNRNQSSGDKRDDDNKLRYVFFPSLLAPCTFVNSM